MSQTDERLLRCFQAVFPDLDERQALRATMSNIGEWDSVATTNLVAVVEEEFGVQFAPTEIEKLNSFQAFAARLGA